MLACTSILAYAVNREMMAMKMERVMVQLPKGTKAKLDGLRQHGTSISGFIRSIVERELNHATTGRKAR